MKHRICFAALIWLSVIPSDSFAHSYLNLEDQQTGCRSMYTSCGHIDLTDTQTHSLVTADKKQLRVQRRLLKLQHLLTSEKGMSMMGGLDDSVDKFFWFWLIGWGAGFLIILIGSAIVTGGFGILSILGVLFALGGTLSLIAWLVKKFG